MGEKVETTLPDKQENGLSRDEQKWLSDWFSVIDKNQAIQNNLLGQIKSWMTFFGILAILSLVISFLNGIGIFK